MQLTFAFPDLLTVAFLALLEILLSADNAAVLALFASKLPKDLQKKALFIGFFSALVLRLIVLLTLSYFAYLAWFQFIGAAYLLYLSFSFWMKKKKQPPKRRQSVFFWGTVLRIEFYDLIFAFDSILAGIAFIAKAPSQGGIFYAKIWIVYLGGIIGALTIRFAATFFLNLIARFPALEAAAFVMVGWVGLKLALTATSLTFPYFPFVFWSGLVALLAWGLLGKKRKPS